MKFHKQSYRPDLPTNGMQGLAAWADRMVKLDMERTYGVAWHAKGTEIRPNVPHPRSAYAHLPLRGAGGALTATAADRRYWSEHPLTYPTPEETAAWQARYAASITDPSRWGVEEHSTDTFYSDLAVNITLAYCIV